MEDRYGSRDDNLEDELEAAPSVELSPTSRLLRQAKQRKKQTGDSRIRSEMSKYEAFSYAARDSNILYWWKCNETLLPLLARIARIILAIPPSSCKECGDRQKVQTWPEEGGAVDCDQGKSFQG